MLPNQNIKLDDEGLPDWEPVSFYDAPATVLTQLYDGEGSLGRAVRTFMREETLSPKERDSYVQRIKKATGDNAVSNFAIDVALNPLVWMLVLTSPASRRQIARSGGRILSGVSELGTVSRKMIDGLRHLHLLGSAFGNEHAVTSRAINYLGNRTDEIHQQIAAVVGEKRGAALTHVGEVIGKQVNDFDHTRFAGSEVGRKLQVFNTVLDAMKAGRFIDDAEAVKTVVSTARVARVKSVDPADTIGEHYTILPAVADKTAHIKYKAGETYSVKDSRGVVQTFEILDEPIVANSQENHKRAQELLRQPLPHLTVERVPLVDEDRLPITREQGRQLLQQEGFDLRIVQEYVDADIQKERMLGAMALGVTPTMRNGRPYINVNPDKVLTMLQQRRENGEAYHPRTQAEQEATLEIVGSMTDAILPDWVEQAIVDNTMTKTTLNSVVKSLYETQLNNPFYSTRSVANQWTREGNLGVRKEAYDVIGLGRDKNDPLRVSSMAMLRERDTALLDPGDLKFLKDQLSQHNMLTDEQGRAFGSFIRRSEAALNKMIQENQMASTLPMDFERATRAYEQKMVGHITLYGDDVPAHLLQELQGVKSSKSALDKRDRTYFELAEPDFHRKQTYDMLGIGAERLENIRFGDASYPRELKFSFASRRYLEKIAEINNHLRSATDPAEVNRLTRLLNVYERERAFIRDFRMPFSSAKDPRNMREFFSMLMPRENRQTQEVIEGFVFPRMFGGAQGNNLIALTSLQAVRHTAERFANSSAGQYFKSLGGPFAALHDKAAAFAQQPIYLQDAANLNRDVAGYLYSTHLSSLVTGMWNAFQPFTWGATWLGVPEVLAAYPKAIKQLMGYKAERAKLGLIAEPGKRREIWQKHVPLSNFHGRDLTMMDDNVLSTFDSAIASGRVQGKPGIVRTLFMDIPLKFFQTIEQLNRIVMAEAGFSRVNKSATGLSPLQIADEVQTIQSMSNFASQMTTKPRLLQDPNTGMGILANPSMGMLLQYPMRFATNVATSGMVYGGKREFGLQKFGGPSFEIPAQIGDLGRLLGISAVVYEAGKNLMGLNLSQGLAASSLSSGVPQILGGGGWLPVPIDIPVGIVQGLVEEDREQLRRQMFRLIPYGIPLSKALGALPPIPGVGGPFGLVQSQYADWKNPNAQGQIPVYRDDGTLQSFETPLNLVMRGISFDVKRHQNPQDATKFLLANRAQIVDLKRKYKDAVLGNNMALAGQIEQEYQKRFGVSMTVKPDEWDQAIKLREVTLGERMVDTMSSDVRGLYQQSLAGPMGSTYGLPDGGLYAGDAAAQRDKIRQFSSGLSNPALSSGNFGSQ